MHSPLPYLNVSYLLTHHHWRQAPGRPDFNISRFNIPLIHVCGMFKINQHRSLKQGVTIHTKNEIAGLLQIRKCKIEQDELKTRCKIKYCTVEYDTAVCQQMNGMKL